jgi:hypothetical protein
MDKQIKICVERHPKIKEQKMRSLHIQSGGKLSHQELSAAFFKDFLWPQNSVIKISFAPIDNITSEYFTDLDDLNEPLDPLCVFVRETKDPRISIKKIVLERFQPLVNLKFVFVDRFEDGDIRIGWNNKDGAWSYIGTDILNSSYEGESTMNLGWIDAPTILHEFGHSLALIHEHQNPKGGIKWNKDAVYAWASKAPNFWDKETTDVNILKQYDKDSINGSVFDINSIMLYFFPSSLTVDNCCPSKQNSRLSSLDVLWISKKYGNGAQMTPESFYKQVYKEPLNTTVKENFTLIESLNYTPTVIILICFIFVFMIFIISIIVLK